MNNRDTKGIRDQWYGNNNKNFKIRFKVRKDIKDNLENTVKGTFKFI